MGDARWSSAWLGLCCALALAASPAAAQNKPKPKADASQPKFDPDKARTDASGKPVPPRRLGALNTAGIPTYFRYRPTAYCSDREKASFIRDAEGELSQAEHMANQARDYRESMGRRIEAERKARDFISADADEAELNKFLAEDIEGITVSDVNNAQAQLDAAKAAKVIDCIAPNAFETFRPVDRPVSIPEIPDQLCTQQEIDALVAKSRAEMQAAQASAEAWGDYRVEASRRRSNYYYFSPPGVDKAAIQKALDAEVTFAVEHSRQASDVVRKAVEAWNKASRLKPMPCPQKTPESVPASLPVLPAPPPGVPPPPDYEDTSIGPVPLFCTPEKKNGWLQDVIDPAIARANRNVEKANAYVARLNQYFLDRSGHGAAPPELEAIKAYTAAVGEDAKRRYAEANALASRRKAEVERPLAPCPSDQPQPTAPPATQPAPPAAPAPRPGGGARVCPPRKKAGRAPINLGSNARLGSGARAKSKALSTLTGLAGGLLGGGGGGGGSNGPSVADCKIKDSEKTLFEDSGSGISLKVGAKRSGDTVVVFADVAKSPDSGTFQGGWLENPDGDLAAPSKVDICGLWGEWSLSVSWTKTTYVDGQIISRESGGYSKSGSFSLPGMLSSDAAPAGLWKQLGFSNASHGARQVALQYRIPKAQLQAAPMHVLIHVTRPARNPVDTQPFDLVMREAPSGAISFSRAGPDPDVCPADALAVDKLIKEKLNGADPRDPEAVARELLKRYPEGSAPVERERPGLPPATPPPAPPAQPEPTERDL